MATVNSNTDMLNSEDSSCLPNLILFIVLVLLSYSIIAMIFQKPRYDDDDDDNDYFLYGIYEDFTPEDIPNGCEVNVDYTNSANMLCQKWYIRNVLKLDTFTDNIPQDEIIDTIFPLGNIALPLYSKSFKKIPDIINDKTIAIRISQFMIQSLDKIRAAVNSTYSKLNSTLNISSDKFDPFMLSAISENSLLNILLGMYEHIVHSFFQVVLSNNDNSTSTTLTLLYLMPLMIFLKTNMSRLMDSLQIILSSINKGSIVKVSTLDPSLFLSTKKRVNDESTYVQSKASLKNMDKNLPFLKNVPDEFNNYRSIVFDAVMDTLQKCSDQITTIRSNTVQPYSTEEIIQGDLIHVFYRSYIYFVSVIKLLNSPSSKLPEDNTFVVKYYEIAARKILTNTQPLTAFDSPQQVNTSININQTLSSFSSVEGLKKALIDISLAIDTSLLNTLATYSTPGTIGTLFMQLINTKPEILSMNVSQANEYIHDYMQTLSEEYLLSVIPVPTERNKEYFESYDNILGYNDHHDDNKRFSVGRCINKCIRDGKKRIQHSNRHTPSYEMFGDNFNSGTLQATPTSNSDYNTTGTFVTDSKGNFVLDSAGNEILSSDYKNKKQQGSSKNTNTSGLYVTDSKGNYVLDPNGNKIKSQDYMTSINYVPALDAPYPKLQSQLGKAAYDIRGIPDTPLSTAPVTGISGRPVV